MLPSPWDANYLSTRSRSPHSPTAASTSFRSDVSHRPVQLHGEYRKAGGVRPQSQSAVVMLGGVDALVVNADVGADDLGLNPSRFSTYTRAEVKKLDESLLLWMERLTTTPTSSTEDVTSSHSSHTPPLSPSSSSTTTSPEFSHKRLPPPILTARGLGIFSEGLPSPPSSTTTAGGSLKSAPTTPRGRATTIRKWWKGGFRNTGQVVSEEEGEREGAHEWEVVSSQTPEDTRTWGEAVSTPYAFVSPHPHLRPRSKSVAAAVRKRTTAKLRGARSMRSTRSAAASLSNE